MFNIFNSGQPKRLSFGSGILALLILLKLQRRKK